MNIFQTFFNIFKNNLKQFPFIIIAGCHLNGQNVFEEREVTLSEDPCVKCECNGKRLSCVKKACPVLQCPPSLQWTPPGQCCKKCTKNIPYMQPTKGKICD